MSNLFDLSGRVALVTGASRGLGHQFARVLAGAGADLAITSRTFSSLEPFAAEIRALGRRVACVELNVREQASIEKAVADVLAELGHIDILINNAGCNIRKRAVEVSWDDWNTILDTNLRGAFFVAQAVARHMIERRTQSVDDRRAGSVSDRSGRIINIGSVTCVAGYAGLGPYGASRGGVKQLTMSLAHDWGEYGITVNCLAPGWFKTDQNRALYEVPGWVEYLCERIPLGRPGTPSDLDGALLLLASDAGRYITGQTLLVDGGVSVGAVRAVERK
jgi:NAD(P)-dependent dehydrogenase (short-subunit alcohol dehydrogenase family)